MVIAGHTHAVREIRVSLDHTYFNTGTWTYLIAFPFVVADETLKTWIDRLEVRTVPRVKRLTWAEITPDRVALHEASG